MAFTKLYDNKHAITAADALNDRVYPFFEEQQIPVLRMLTDRGTEYNGKVEYGHDYELYLIIEGIDHSRTKVRHPQSNASVRGSTELIQEEFYAIAFRKKLYSSLDDLQMTWMSGLNIIISSGLIVADIAREKLLCKHGMIIYLWLKIRT